MAKKHKHTGIFCGCKKNVEYSQEFVDKILAAAKQPPEFVGTADELMAWLKSPRHDKDRSQP